MSNPEYRATLTRGTTLTRVEGKDVLFSVRTGETYGLNEMAADMLRRLFELGSGEAVRALAADYAAPATQIGADLFELASELAGLKLIELQR